MSANGARKKDLFAEISRLQSQLAQVREENERFKKGDVYRQGLDDGERHARFQYEVEIDRLRKVAQAAREFNRKYHEWADDGERKAKSPLDGPLAALDESANEGKEGVGK